MRSVGLLFCVCVGEDKYQATELQFVLLIKLADEAKPLTFQCTFKPALVGTLQDWEVCHVSG